MTQRIVVEYRRNQRPVVTATWDDGVFSGPPHIVALAEAAADTATVTQVGLIEVEAGTNTLLGAVAALYFAGSGTAFLRHAPEELHAQLERLVAEQIGDRPTPDGKTLHLVTSE